MNNPISRLLRNGDPSVDGTRTENVTTTEETLTTKNNEEPNEESVEEPDEKTKPAYDFSRDNTVRFSDSVTIDTEDEGEFATITVETIADSITFDVRIAGYTSRFGELDVDYISVGGYALNLYHSRPDIEEYFVRRLYYYGDENGIGGEQHRESSSEPNNYVWERESDFGSTIQSEFNSTHITVYDWRENMFTSKKPTPDDGEVVVQYKDSLRSGGNRNAINNVFNATEAQGVVGDRYTVHFISVDPNTGSYVLHSTAGEKSCHISTPLDANSSLSNCEIEEVDELDSPLNSSDVIWTRDPEQTWAIKGFDPTEADNQTATP